LPLSTEFVGSDEPILVVYEVEEGRVRLLVDDSLTVEGLRWRETDEVFEMQVG
jgi:hypothetical protein